ncbi:uncharacterized protein A1O5_04024 [Cladophialophora psammophila CBS 110553]|uniref:chitinase n=1 Tax=Cladophialophora psammophila CBS 110553 TaxID=1182543 RepID=W9X7K1_9EURO|nr:uncharacterized protein A1O5_04024 [Cladophialophora psammophila CBS 110553]EXJ72876.1 hypothetical protein A1O5_04024 [Cladophialophora psammophila CBS 110553]
MALAFMPASVFNEENPSLWPLFTTVASVRPKFAHGAAIMVAIGGWGATASFSIAAATQKNRRRFAYNVRAMVDQTGPDVVNIDWEYPGGNGEDYKQIPNSEKAWEIEAYPELLQEIRLALGPDKSISAAVPGHPREMLAFTKETMPKISSVLDFINVMTYDLVNRRDNVTGHHTGLASSLAGIEAFLENGLEPEKANLGFAFYPRWYKTDPNGNCGANPMGCKTLLMEDPSSGADLGRAGAFAWSDDVPTDLSMSFHRALPHGLYDNGKGGHYFWDTGEDIFWSWDTPVAISKKFPAIMERLSLGGVFAWGLGEDSSDWPHLQALTANSRGSREAQRISNGRQRTNSDRKFVRRKQWRRRHQRQASLDCPAHPPREYAIQ